MYFIFNKSNNINCYDTAILTGGMGRKFISKKMYFHPKCLSFEFKVIECSYISKYRHEDTICHFM